MPLASLTGAGGETPYCLVLTTVPSEERAQTLAREIVEARLGACVQIDHIHSVYRWDGQLCSEPECRLMIKTRNARFEVLEHLDELKAVLESGPRCLWPAGGQGRLELCRAATHAAIFREALA